MNLSLSGHHLLITPAIRDYVTAKLDRVTRHFDHVIDVNVVLSVDKLRQQVTANRIDDLALDVRVDSANGGDPLIQRIVG